MYLFVAELITFLYKSQSMYDEPTSFSSKSRIKAAVERNLAILYMRRIV